MGRPKKPVEVPGQEPETDAELLTGTIGEAIAPDPQRAEPEIIQQRVASLLDDAALAERNTLLGTINEQGAAVIARFETLGYTDLADQQLTDNLEFLQLVKKATTAEPAAPLGYVTNDEGKRQPVTGKPVLTEHGWHVPG
ncbi:hypothetical protein ACK1D1_001003 [Salmonella enterica]|uniref:Uncharacterized protein n=1 Tax=Salmonella enterica TaxID=28901 RepID=A0A764X4K3_SALER|nr:hypothetical protein [Salmonella enterica subsp. enterica serovar Newport]EFN2629811.1 hypothetical protein [Salmonella enterica subsp. enterica serovar Albany]EGO0462060.1 hypothetical protein [Salmonella enterica]EFN2634419.1 hypothetical protein [Salmonella enterica subsp. enterica serovar Albany]EGO0572965.1 hypothetical protein [Salmonella enterica]